MKEISIKPVTIFKLTIKYGLRILYDPEYRIMVYKRYRNRQREERLKVKYGSGHRKYKNARYRARKKIFLKRIHGSCVFCRGKFRIGELTIDHIIPRSKGGTNDKSNLQVLCKGCHKLKDNV
jgi:5-methylcytosine-specific restriction endonuclease McrA